ncbi:MAG: N-acetyl sugar amidotransferase [Thermodesulfobacteriota bacterium]
MELDAKYSEPWLERWGERFANPVQVCSRCVYDAKVPNIVFDADGVCNYCHLSERLDREHPTGEAGRRILEATAARIKRENKNKPFDLVVGVSGGCDSSYLVILAKELGLRPLAAHFDNTWNSTIAVENIRNVLDKLGVELFTYVVDNEEYDDIYRAFLKAGVPDLESPTDIGLATTLYLAAEKYGIKYIYEGHSFRTEGVSPLGWLYMDAKYIQSIHKQFGAMPMKSFPNLWFWSQMRWMVLRRIKKLRPLYYVDYQKEPVKGMLACDYGWQWYGGHHLENRMTHFYHTYFLPRRFGIDQRMNGFAALVRSGQMEREQALHLLRQPPEVDFELVAMVKKRLGLGDEEFERLMEQPRRYYTEFKTYKPLFEKLRPMFYVLSEMDLVPKSFYLKYTSKKNI